MSDYDGTATLEDWLAIEVFQVDSVPSTVVLLFERWREDVENNINAWFDSDTGEGPRSWRGWGRGFYAISDADNELFDDCTMKAEVMMRFHIGR
jgi:hypothetical protein